MAIQFSELERYELNDAINETVKRMLNDGQSTQEIEMQSLRHLWSAWQKVTFEILGTTDTYGMREMAPMVQAAISEPKLLKSKTTTLPSCKLRG